MIRKIFNSLSLVILAAAVIGSFFLVYCNVPGAIAQEPPEGDIGEPYTIKDACEELVPFALDAWKHEDKIEIECYVETKDLTIPGTNIAIELAYADHLGGNKWRIGLRPLLHTYSYDGFAAVIIHEVGHCLLIRHNQNPASVMFPIIFDSNLQQIDDWDRHMYGVRWHGFKTVLSDLASDKAVRLERSTP